MVWHVDSRAYSIFSTIPAAIVRTMECWTMLRLGLTGSLPIYLDRGKSLSGQLAQVGAGLF